MTLRLAVASDAPAIQGVIRTVYEEYGFSWDPEGYHADIYDLEGHYLQYGDRFWIAELDGAPVGCVGLEVFPPHPGELGTLIEVDGMLRAAGADSELCRLYVLPQARGRQLGRLLTETVLQAARAAGCRGLELWSDKALTHAHRLYESMGAERIGDRICNDPDEAPEWGMIFRL